MLAKGELVAREGFKLIEDIVGKIIRFSLLRTEAVYFEIMNRLVKKDSN
jgi:hypothetical protein